MWLLGGSDSLWDGATESNLLFPSALFFFFNRLRFRIFLSSDVKYGFVRVRSFLSDIISGVCALKESGGWVFCS